MTPQKTIKQKKDEVAAMTPAQRATAAEEDRLAKIETDKTKVTQSQLDQITASGQDVFRGKNIQALSAQEQTGQKAADVIVERQRQIVAAQNAVAPQQPQTQQPQTQQPQGQIPNAPNHIDAINQNPNFSDALKKAALHQIEKTSIAPGVSADIPIGVKLGVGAAVVGGGLVSIPSIIGESAAATEISSLSLYSKAKAVFLGTAAVATLGIGVESSINSEVTNVQKDNTDIIEAVSKGGMSGSAALDTLEKNAQSLQYLEKAAHISNMADWKRLVGLGGAVERKIITTQRDTENKKEIVRQMILAGTISL